jgi:hypothetical protein
VLVKQSSVAKLAPDPGLAKTACLASINCVGFLSKSTVNRAAADQQSMLKSAKTEKSPKVNTLPEIWMGNASRHGFRCQEPVGVHASEAKHLFTR